jgi:hypothetical protein
MIFSLAEASHCPEIAAALGFEQAQKVHKDTRCRIRVVARPVMIYQGDRIVLRNRLQLVIRDIGKQLSRELHGA